MSVPAGRIQAANGRPLQPRGAHVLYWMTAARRSGWNFGLQRAVEAAAELDRPVVVLEALRCGYRWANDRLHRFVMAGMADNRRRLSRSGLRYHAYVEPAAGAGRGLLEALAARACLVVTDDYPCFFLPRMVEAAGRRLKVRLEKVDSNGLLPMREADRVFPTAHAFRRFLQKTLPSHLEDGPAADPLRRARIREAPPLAKEILRRWPSIQPDLADLPIDHSVPPVARKGGSAAAGIALDDFLARRLSRYAEDRNEPGIDGSSGLSPWLHFGQLSVHEVFSKLAAREGWTPAALGRSTAGHRAGWWGMSAPAEAFLDELVTWRELGFNFCSQRDDTDRYESLPPWARATLEKHAKDPRSPRHVLREFEAAATQDPLWNAAQRQLLREGRIHNYLRMLWGKKILDWSASPREALATMIELNNKYALDGRDPNSYSGICWVLGRYDRPWGPERPVFGTVRYMSSANTARKLDVKGYLERYGPSSSGSPGGPGRPAPRPGRRGAARPRRASR